MSTVIRSELSKDNKYYISKHRYLELKHFCLQYEEWKNQYQELDDLLLKSAYSDGMPTGSDKADLTAVVGIKKARIANKIRLVEESCQEADKEIGDYILIAVTEDRAFPYLKTVLDIPCGKDMYYDRYRRFFSILDKKL